MVVSYEILIGGYGAEIKWSKLTEEQYLYWDNQDKSLLERHILGKSLFDDDDDDEDTTNFFNNIPEYADLNDKGTKEWYEIEDLDSEYYCSADSAWLNITKNNKTNQTNFDPNLHTVIEYNNIINDSSSNNVNIFVDTDNDNDNDNNSCNCSNGINNFDADYALQIVSYEKGTFFSGILELNDDEEFDINKFKIHISTALNGDEQRIDSVFYNDTEIDNDGGDTRCKGIDVYLVEL
jgi:hypothetical protein